MPAQLFCFRSLVAHLTVWVASAPFRSGSFVSGCAKLREVQMFCFEAGIISRSMQGMPRSFRTVRSPTMVKCLLAKASLALRSCQALVIPKPASFLVCDFAKFYLSDRLFYRI
jgi:hypothetical protein